MRVFQRLQILHAWWGRRTLSGKLAMISAPAILLPLTAQLVALTAFSAPSHGAVLLTGALAAVASCAIFAVGVLRAVAPLRRLEKMAQDLADAADPGGAARCDRCEGQANDLSGYIATLHDHWRSEVASYRSEAETDPLTGLFNRRGLDTWRQDIDSAALLYVDVDNFKRINDGLGHAAGDAMLKRTAEVLLSATRDHDVVARIGGDEFVILLPDISQASALVIAERLRSATATQLTHELGHVTVSIGVSHLNGGRWERALDLADEACYAAKRAGRDRVFSKAERGRTHQAAPAPSAAG